MIFIIIVLCGLYAGALSQSGVWNHNRDPSLSQLNQNLTICVKSGRIFGRWAKTAFFEGSVTSSGAATGKWASAFGFESDQPQLAFAYDKCGYANDNRDATCLGTPFSGGGYFNSTFVSGSFSLQFSSTSFSGTYTDSTGAFSRSWSGTIISSTEPTDPIFCGSTVPITNSNLVSNMWSYGDAGSATDYLRSTICSYDSSKFSSPPSYFKIKDPNVKFLFDIEGVFQSLPTFLSTILIDVGMNSFLCYSEFPTAQAMYPVAIPAICMMLSDTLFVYSAALPIIPGTILSFSPPALGPGPFAPLENVYVKGTTGFTPSHPELGCAAQNAASPPSPSPTTSFSHTVFLPFSIAVFAI